MLKFKELSVEEPIQMETCVWFNKDSKEIGSGYYFIEKSMGMSKQSFVSNSYKFDVTDPTKIVWMYYNEYSEWVREKIMLEVK